MKISEVEELVGITKKNIRFYEAQGLLEPGRNHENGYRDYSENDVHVLEQIKLMRKLGLPLEEIRMMQAGRSTIADSMRRHLVTLQREQQNLEESMQLCETLCQREGMLTDLDAQQILQQMESMEKGGTSFHDIEQKDIRQRSFLGASCAAAVMILLMLGTILFMLWAFFADPKDAPPLPLMIVLIGLPLLIILGVLFSLLQCIGEIKKGEAYDARKF